MLNLNHYLKENNEAYYKTNDVQLKLQELKPFIEGNTEAEKLYNNIYLELNSLQMLLSKDDLNESDSFRYVTTHGTGPGTLPKDVNLIKSEDINSNGRIAIYVDRPLTKEELEKYDIKPEWIQESANLSPEDWKCFEHHKNEFKDYYELPHGILFRDKNKPIYGVIMDGKFMLDAEPIPKDGEYRTDNSTLDKIKIKDDDFTPVEDFVDYYIPSDYKYDAVADGRCPYCDKKLTANDEWYIKKYSMCQDCFENGVE